MQIGATLVNEKPQISTQIWYKSLEEAQPWVGRVMCNCSHYLNPCFTIIVNRSC